MTDAVLKRPAKNWLWSLRRRARLLLDDREERAGVKFKDADLTAFVTDQRSRKAAEGVVELVTRRHGTSVDVKLSEAVDLVKERVAEDALLTAVESKNSLLASSC